MQFGLEKFARRVIENPAAEGIAPMLPLGCGVKLLRISLFVQITSTLALHTRDPARVGSGMSPISQPHHIRSTSDVPVSVARVLTTSLMSTPQLRHDTVSTHAAQKGHVEQSARQLQGAALCGESCYYASDGYCDDGGPGADYIDCTLGSDCTDCGDRTPPSLELGSPFQTHLHPPSAPGPALSLPLSPLPFPTEQPPSGPASLSPDAPFPPPAQVVQPALSLTVHFQCRDFCTLVVSRCSTRRSGFHGKRGHLPRQCKSQFLNRHFVVSWH